MFTLCCLTMHRCFWNIRMHKFPSWKTSKFKKKTKISAGTHNNASVMTWTTRVVGCRGPTIATINHLFIRISVMYFGPRDFLIFLWRESLCPFVSRSMCGVEAWPVSCDCCCRHREYLDRGWVVSARAGVFPRSRKQCPAMLHRAPAGLGMARPPGPLSLPLTTDFCSWRPRHCRRMPRTQKRNTVEESSHLFYHYFLKEHNLHNTSHHQTALSFLIYNTIQYNIKLVTRHM